MRFSTLAVVVLCVFTAPSLAQVGYGTPEDVAAAALRADSVHDWRLLLVLAHPDALREYQRSQVQALKEDAFQFPGIDACEVKELQKYNRFLLDSVFRVPTADSLTRLPPDTVFVRQHRYYDLHWPRRAPVDSFTPARRIVGNVLADDSTAYVVIESTYERLPFPDWPKRRAEIMTVRRYRGSWRTMLDPNLGEQMSGFAMLGGDCQ
jgi:hypothetical protein